MQEPAQRSELTRRLHRLPGQLFVALVNATTLLVVVAAVLAIVAVNRVNHAAAELAGTVTDAVIAEFDIDPARLLNNVRELTAEVRELRAAVSEGRAEWSRQMEQRTETLTQTLTDLDATLTNASARLTYQTIRQIGDSVTDGLLRLRHCSEQAQP